MVVSSCLGTGVYAITGQLAEVASPGAVLIGWLIVGIGFFALALSFNNLAQKRPDLNGIFTYAQAGFGPFAGFLSGWGYWLAGWLGNVAFATMLMSTIGYFFPAFLPGNTVPCVIVASILLWALVALVMRGVEQAAFLNAIIMVCKVLPIAVTVLYCLFLFQPSVFTADFWGLLQYNLANFGAGSFLRLEGISEQVTSCLIIMMWCFLGIEGASVVSARAKKRSNAGKATVIGFLCLMVIYVTASVLPYGYLPYTEIAEMNYPALLYVFDAMAPGWGGTFIACAIIITILGAWLSFTILPTETTSRMADERLLPVSWGKLNKHNAPQHSLIIMSLCAQTMLIILLFSEDAYNFAFSMCTVTVVVAWAFAAAYQVRYSLQERQPVQLAVGIVALGFQLLAVAFNGWSFLLLACVGYIPGFVAFAKARRDDGQPITRAQKAGIGIISGLGVLAIVLVLLGIITF